MTKTKPWGESKATWNPSRFTTSRFGVLLEVWWDDPVWRWSALSPRATGADAHRYALSGQAIMRVMAEDQALASVDLILRVGDASAQPSRVSGIERVIGAARHRALVSGPTQSMTFLRGELPPSRMRAIRRAWETGRWTRAARATLSLLNCFEHASKCEVQPTETSGGYRSVPGTCTCGHKERFLDGAYRGKRLDEVPPPHGTKGVRATCHACAGGLGGHAFSCKKWNPYATTPPPKASSPVPTPANLGATSPKEKQNPHRQDSGARRTPVTRRASPSPDSAQPSRWVAKSAEAVLTLAKRGQAKPTSGKRSPSSATCRHGFPKRPKGKPTKR
jgi:hypothetical protein